MEILFVSLFLLLLLLFSFSFSFFLLLLLFFYFIFDASMKIPPGNFTMEKVVTHEKLLSRGQ